MYTIVWTPDPSELAMKGLVKNLAYVSSAGISVGVDDGKNATSAEQHSSSTDDRNTVEHALANHMVLWLSGELVVQIPHYQGYLQKELWQVPDV